jgi:hypothetical protein
MDKLKVWVHQPTTIGGVGLMVGAAVYWVSKSPELALMAAGLVLGTVNDHTSGILTSIENLEDAVRSSKPKE